MSNGLHSSVLPSRYSIHPFTRFSQISMFKCNELTYMHVILLVWQGHTTCDGIPGLKAPSCATRHHTLPHSCPETSLNGSPPPLYMPPHSQTKFAVQLPTPSRPSQPQVLVPPTSVR